MKRSPQHQPFLVEAIRQLDGAVNAHSRWLGEFHRALVCGSPPGPSVVDADSHRLCAFGRWFHDDLPSDWQRWSNELDEIDQFHDTIHAQARGLFQRRSTDTAIAGSDYDSFVDSSIGFKNALRALEFRMIQEVCLVDHLTGVWNRTSMFQRLTEEQNRMMRTSESCCLCMMDLDHFKEVNDAFGHVAGDDVLQAVVDIGSRQLRSYDSMFRYGGEEFLFCLPNASMDTAVSAMERLRADIDRAKIGLTDQHTVHITASFGVTNLSSTLTVEESIEEADRALFCAKAKGRNQVCRWDIDTPVLTPLPD